MRPEVEFECERCLDTGTFTDFGDEGLGYIATCPCGISHRRRMEGWRGKFGQGGWLWDASFTSFANAPKLPDALNRRNALRAAREWAERAQEDSRPEKPWLILVGSYGTGKTHLAAAAINQLDAANIDALFCEVPRLLDWLRGLFGPHSEHTFEKGFETVSRMRVLALDDLGAQRGTEWADEKLYELINYRYNQGMPLFVTTNKPLDQHDQRIGSRLADKRISVVVDCGNFDYRSVAR